jgi:hypothetical protein
LVVDASERNQQDRTFRTRTVIRAALVLAVLGCCYGLWLGKRLSGLYGSLKAHRWGIEGQLFSEDPTLGVRALPNAEGVQILPLDPGIPIRHDGDGFRIPQSGRPSAGPGPAILSLGCSFTYGWACRAEESYPEVLGALTGGRVMNAAAPGYGLAQMLLLARELIPRERPDYVTVQFSPWLAARAQSPFLPTGNGGLDPAPYFFETDDDTLAVHAPRFHSINSRLAHADYRGGEAGVLDFISYSLRVGIPQQVHDDAFTAWTELQELAGFLPPPTDDAVRVIRHAYGEIARLCVENGARMLVVVIGKTKRHNHLLQYLEGATFVNGQEALYDALP